MRIRCTEISSEFSHLPLDENDAKVKCSALRFLDPLRFLLIVTDICVLVNYLFDDVTVLCRSVSVGHGHGRHQDTAPNKTNTVHGGVDCCAATRPYERHRNVLLIELDPRTGPTRGLGISNSS